MKRAEWQKQMEALSLAMPNAVKEVALSLNNLEAAQNRVELAKHAYNRLMSEMMTLKDLGDNGAST
jgi:hypothetical protein